jgi:hypothetical protein
VGEAKAEISRLHGTTADALQELYRAAEALQAARDGGANTETLDGESMLVMAELKQYGSEIATTIGWWQIYSEPYVHLSEGGAMATQRSSAHSGISLSTSSVELAPGVRYYWEVELLSEDTGIFIGVSRPNLDCESDYALGDCTDAWFLHAYDGTLFGNGKEGCDAAGAYKQGDRCGVLLDLVPDSFYRSSLRFFKNGVPHGPGYGAGSISGPVVHAVQMYLPNQCVRLLPNAVMPDTWL